MLTSGWTGRRRLAAARICSRLRRASARSFRTGGDSISYTLTELVVQDILHRVVNIHRDPVIGTYFTEALMHAFHGKNPARFLADFYTSFTADLLADEGDAAPIVDRYHTPDVVQYADGVRIDRDRLIAHAQPVRRNHPEVRVEVH